jgi:hydroxyacylglutathione hydrolase
MIFRQFLDDDLGCASYLIGDAGEAVVVDPSWNVAPYLEFASAHRLRIVKVLETHTHADHVSGRGGNVVTCGDLRIEAVATPGHRPEHLALVVTDLRHDARPVLVLSGDSLLAGDVARPDLATANASEIDEAARNLFESAHQLAALSDHVELWPGHIGGSLCCSSGTSEKPSSTIGFERRVNPGLTTLDPDRFAADLLSRLPERPPTVERVVELNRGPLIGEPPTLQALGVDEIQSLFLAGAAIVDGRSATGFDEANIPGSLCLPLDRPGVGTRAAWLLDSTRPLVLVAANEAQAHVLAARLAAVGLLDVAGWLAGGLKAWQARGQSLGSVERVDVEVAAKLVHEQAAVLVDVRDPDEWEAGVVEGSMCIPWRELRRREREVQTSGKPILVACASGGRTATAASVLARAGGPPVLRLAEGGIADLSAYGHELVEPRSGRSSKQIAYF